MEGEYDEDELNPALEPKQRRAVAESIIGEVEWSNDLEGFCECPGADQHTNPTGYNHCRIRLDGVPTIQCFHRSCKTVRDAANRKLRSKLPALADGQPKGSGKPAQKYRQLHAIEAKAAAALKIILSDFAWSDEGVASAFAKVSPLPIPADPIEQTRLFLGTLFDPDDVVWIGQKHHTGQPHHRRHFRTVNHWLDGRTYGGEFTCASTFAPGSHERRNSAVYQRRFTIIESDGMSFGRMAGVFQFLETLPDWRLRAVVYSGGKSLHGWFEGAPLSWPPDDLAAFVRGLRCDDATLRPSQPVRLPGVLRADTRVQQALLYLSASTLH